MKKLIYFAVVTIFISSFNFSNVFAQENTNDAFYEMLNRVGISEQDLGFRPKGYWTRYPDPKDIPYKMLSFDDLLAEPQRIYDFVRNMALSVDDYLHPDYMKANHNSLLKLAYYCGVRNATGEFRQYSASLWAEVDSTEPLLKAIKEIYTTTHRVWRYNAMGNASDFPLIEKDLMAAIKNIHPEVQKAVARTVLHLLEAYRFAKIGIRNVDRNDAIECWRIRQLGETQFDGLEYFPQLEDAAQSIDINSIYYAGYKMLESSLQLADTLTVMRTSKLKIDWEKQNLNIMTPIGRIVLSGTGNDKHQYSDLLLLVDFGGDDEYRGAVGSTPSLEIPVSLAIDLDGNDKYINDDEYLPSQGAGVFGAGMLLDMKGDDEYTSMKMAQGAAMLGIGILADMEGNDVYKLGTDGQGGAYFGVGLAIDNRGDDKYFIDGDGQGYGGVGGVGTLVNRSGNDFYRAEPKASVVFRPDYHSKDGKLNYSYAQGCGVGRRGDVTDGHSWAGGMGTLIDLEGDDVYESANWSLGCGYWYGIGFIYDGAGNDKYHSASWSQAAGAHFCIGALIDEGGNDEHILWEEQSVGIGFGHDYTVALFLNRGGNDKYQLKDDGLGFAINKSQVFMFDTDGDDTYIRSGKGRNYGWNNFDSNNPPEVESIFHLYSDQICFFADVNGTDKYILKDYDNGKESVDTLMKDGAENFVPADKSNLASKKFYGLGKDFTDWKGPEIEFFRDKMKKKYPEFKK